MRDQEELLYGRRLQKPCPYLVGHQGRDQSILLAAAGTHEACAQLEDHQECKVLSGTTSTITVSLAVGFSESCALEQQRN